MEELGVLLVATVPLVMVPLVMALYHCSLKELVWVEDLVLVEAAH